MSGRGWVIGALAAAGAATATVLVVRSARRGELTGPRLPAVRNSGLDVRAAAGRAAERVADLVGQAGAFISVASQESAAKEAELRARLGLDD
ncbi:hypothetical protein [Acidipropionibacterium virtanenii]|uniref:Uncharacterized protein n=1 Tax=Acidipropionibacterium virtanenii TaxID=2057246 RepID=A0A344UU45_9ACTN|nr:hypothetical protein [Acidipropionibacterium virtanenii]AXE38793.1 hypothetical protein JS278_01629 [Acidipropionibacterium virtanenii]